MQTLTLPQFTVTVWLKASRTRYCDQHLPQFTPKDSLRVTTRLLTVSNKKECLKRISVYCEFISETVTIVSGSLEENVPWLP